MPGSGMNTALVYMSWSWHVKAKSLDMWNAAEDRPSSSSRSLAIYAAMSFIVMLLEAGCPASSVYETSTKLSSMPSCMSIGCSSLNNDPWLMVSSLVRHTHILEAQHGLDMSVQLLQHSQCQHSQDQLACHKTL